MNLLHTSFSVGALAAPLIVGTLVEGGVPWQTVVVATGVVLALLAVAYAVIPMPSGRRATAGVATATSTTAGHGVGHSLLAGPLLLLGIAIAAYVASEVGVSNWIVRFLEPAPLTTATLALSLFWAGLTVGRLVSSAIADRFDHVRFTVACSLVMGAMIGLAVLAPTLPISIAAFAVGGDRGGPGVPDDRGDRRRAVPGAVGRGRWIADRHGRDRLDPLSAGDGLPVGHGRAAGCHVREHAAGDRLCCRARRLQPRDGRCAGARPATARGWDRGLTAPGSADAQGRGDPEPGSPSLPPRAARLSADGIT